MKTLTLYDAAQSWSDAQWARFLQCDKKDIPSIRQYMYGLNDSNYPIFLSGCFIEKQPAGFDVHFHFADFYWYSSKEPFATHNTALDYSKDFLMRFTFNKTMQKILNVPRYATMMMKIYGIEKE